VYFYGIGLRRCQPCTVVPIFEAIEYFASAVPTSDHQLNLQRQNRLQFGMHNLPSTPFFSNKITINRKLFSISRRHESPIFNIAFVDGDMANS
jgi:hypothetical protein